MQIFREKYLENLRVVNILLSVSNIFVKEKLKFKEMIFSQLKRNHIAVIPSRPTFNTKAEISFNMKDIGLLFEAQTSCILLKT